MPNLEGLTTVAEMERDYLLEAGRTNHEQEEENQ